MALVGMKKVQLIVHASVITDVLDVAQQHAAIEFVPMKNDQLDVQQPVDFELNYVKSRLDFAIQFLSQYAPKRGALSVMLEGTSVNVTMTQIKNVVRRFYATDIIDTVQNVQKNINDAEARIKSLRKERRELLPWRRVSCIVGYDYATVDTETIFVKCITNISKQSRRMFHKDIQVSLGSEKILYHLVAVDAQYAVITFWKDCEEMVMNILTHTAYERVVFEQRRGTPHEEIVRIERAITKTRQLIIAEKKRAKALVKHLSELKILSDHTAWQKDRHDVFLNAHRTKNVLMYEGWCVAGKADDLVKAIAAVTSLATLSHIAPRKNEEVPVEIDNNDMVQPFETITRLYGLPGAKDIDPTPYLAGFFFVFFGFCLTDVGYGAILASVTGFLLWRYEVISATKTMLQLLFMGGISSIIAGLLFGGYFGADMSQLPVFLQQIQLFEPIENPLPVFYLALVLGVVQIMVGLMVAIWRGHVHRQLRDAVLDNVPWLVFFIALIAWGADSAGMITFSYSVYAIYGAIALIILTQGHKEKNLIMKAFKGVSSLYGSVSYFADILSYSRLMALGLATSALAYAINLIASMAAGTEGERTVIGLFFAGVILVVGHLFNLVINAFGAFIHSARLQFVEFFGKFIFGTGRSFVPFRREEQHVTIKS